MVKGKKIKTSIALLLALLMVLVLALGGCGGKDEDAEEDAAGGIEPAYTSNQGTAPDGILDETVRTEEQSVADGKEKSTDYGQAGTSPLKYGENVKLIYTAYLTLQTTDFEKAEKQLIDLVTASEGYFEASYIDRGNYYSEENYLFSNYTIRIPSDQYEVFLSAVGENCHVVNLNKTTTDVGTDYFDTEARLNTLKAKQERLLELLDQAATMSDIIELENSLSNTQYEIDMYTSTLNRYDSLIGFSTVQVSLEEVARLGTGVNEEEGFFASLGRSLVNGFNNFVDGIESFIMWIAYHLILIALAALIFAVGGKWYIKSRKEKGPLFPKLREKRAFRKAEKAEKRAEKKEDEE